METNATSGAWDARRKRLLFRAQRRGFKEVDLIFGAFAREALGTMDEASLDAFEALLTAPDQEVFTWLKGAEPPPAAYDTPVLAQMKALCARKDPAWIV